jgi:molybdenum cofactor synthesis domain-containing protein
MQVADCVRCAVLTVSSSRTAGSGEPDGSGDLIVDHLEARGWRVVRRGLVADDVDAIRGALHVDGLDLLVITGGTGIAPGDVTPEAVRPLLDRELPGMAEAMRAAGLRNTAHAMLSRQLAGVIGRTLVLALPGSTGACRDCLGAVDPALAHAIALVSGTHQ